MNDDHSSAMSMSGLRQIFVRWERLRIVYNAALVALVVALVALIHDEETNWRRLGFQCLVGAAIANVAFFAGPATEAYLSWLGVRSRAVVVILFSMGLVFAMGLAAITVLTSLGSI
jgi:hypothetical protein